MITISRRLSTKKNSDRIYMFADFEIAEQCPHDESIALGSKYTGMFNLQAEKYR